MARRGVDLGKARNVVVSQAKAWRGTGRVESWLGRARQGSRQGVAGSGEAWFGKASALIQSIPAPVMGGVSFLLYGMIAASGLRLLVDGKVNYAKARNLAMSSVIFVTGLSGAAINIGEVKLTGMCLATIVGMLLGLTFFIIDKLGIANDKDEPDTIE